MSSRRAYSAPRFGWTARGPAAVLALAALFALGGSATQPAPTFASHVASLSEPGGYFDTDNLISNERSYLQILPDLRRAKLRGGAYVGVGPDTNFSYIAVVRPEIAFIIDIRRDNLLLHLLFKALFEISATRLEYLAHLIGRPLPPAIDGWRGAPIDRIVTYLERANAAAPALPALRGRVNAAVKRTGVTLSGDDLATIARFHQRFIDDGLALRFNSIGRPPQAHYPSYRDLLLETDSAGQQANYLASEDAYQFVKSLHARHLIIPVVGDLSGPSAMTAIGRLLARRGEQLTVLYASNVEYYLHGQGTYSRFVANLRQLPRAKNSVIIRSIFGRGLRNARPGDGSSSQVEAIQDVIR